MCGSAGKARRTAFVFFGFHMSPLLALFALFVLTPATAHAQWEYSGGVAIRHVLMKEYDAAGQVLLSERGWLPGVRLRGEYKKDDWRFGLSGEIFGNDVDYDGRTQGGMPFRTDTGTLQSRLGFNLGFALSPDVNLIGALEWDYWKRRIKGHSGVLGIDERFTSWRLIGGADFSLWQGEAGTLRAHALLVASSPEKMRVRFDTQIFDDARLSTKAALGTRLGLSFTPASFPAMTLGVELDWLRIPRSTGVALRQGGVPVGIVTQPEHLRRAVELQLSYRF
jgi:hypothetical protein